LFTWGLTAAGSALVFVFSGAQVLHVNLLNLLIVYALQMHIYVRVKILVKFSLISFFSW